MKTYDVFYRAYGVMELEGRTEHLCVLTIRAENEIEAKRAFILRVNDKNAVQSTTNPNKFYSYYEICAYQID